MKSKIQNYKKKDDSDHIITDEMVLGYKPSIQCLNIHSMAVLLYQFLYKAKDKDSDFKAKAKRSTDKQKIRKILGQKPRLELIDLIDNQRLALLEFLESYAFQEYYVKLFNTISKPSEKASKAQRIRYNKMLLDVKNINMDIYSVLAMLPHAKDFYIEGEFPAYRDIAKDFLSKDLDGENESGKLMYKEINILEIETDENIENGKFINIDLLFGTLRTAAISFYVLMYESKDKTTIRGLKFFESNTKAGLFEVTREDFDNALKAMKKELAPGQMNKTIQAAAGKRYRFLESKTFNLNNNSFEVYTQHAFEGRGQNILSNATKSAPAMVKYITTHPAFFAISAIFQLRSFNNIMQSKDIWSLGISSGQFIAGVASLRALFLEGMIEKGYVNLDIKKFGGQLRLFGRIATVLDIGDSIYKITRLSSKDTDAMLLYLGAAGGGSIVLSLGFLLQGTTYGGWVGLAGAIVVIGIKMAADHFKDTDFETYIKDTVFAKKIH